MRRHDRRVGPRHLTRGQVQAIRLLAPSWGYAKTGAVFDTDPSNVGKIVNRVSWRSK